MPVVEWLCLELGHLAGFGTPSAALVEMPDGMPAALLVERFDIRIDSGDHRRLALEDFCSVLGMPADDKYKGTIERMARALRSLSTDPRQDLATLFARALFAWLIADGDMHLKNLAVLKVASATGRSFDEVRVAPLYDALTTRVFPGLDHDRMALKLAGKDEGLTLRDFETLALTIELPARMARDVIEQLRSALAAAIDTVALPDLVRADSKASATAAAVLDIARSRVEKMA